MHDDLGRLEKELIHREEHASPPNFTWDWWHFVEKVRKHGMVGGLQCLWSDGRKIRREEHARFSHFWLDGETREHGVVEVFVDAEEFHVDAFMKCV